MRRRIFTIISAMSLVLCLATCALWVRSNWVAEQWQIFRWSGKENEPTTFAESTLFVGVCRGIGFNRQWERLDSGLQHSPNADERRKMGYPVHTVLSRIDFAHTGHVWTTPRFFLGFALERDHSSFLEGQIEDSNTLVWVPYWFLVMVFALPPLIWLRRKWRGFGQGLCRRCGYDLRATPGRCPECGTVPPGVKA